MNSAIYSGTVEHRRLSPRAHRFRYRVFMPLLDLDEMPQWLQRCPGWSARRPALAWFRRSDFFGDPRVPLKETVLERVEQVLGERPDGRVLMLGNLRYFGFLINPICCYYCYDSAGTLRAVLAEVTNTPWREKHVYVLAAGEHGQYLQADFDKAMHVSPFMPMGMRYHWRSDTPGERLNLRLANSLCGEMQFDANLCLQRRGDSPWTFTRYLALYPFMTLRVAAGIYWQALRLWLKGVPFIPHPGTVNSENRL